MNELDAAVEGLEARKVVAPWHITFSYVFNIQLKAPAEDQTKAIQEEVQQKQNIPGGKKTSKNMAKTLDFLRACDSL